MNAILKDKSFQLSIILTVIFIGTGIAFLFLGLVDYKLGIEQEHDYVFNNLEKDLGIRYGRK